MINRKEIKGCLIFGHVSIENNVIIAANSVVLDDITEPRNLCRSACAQSEII